MFSIGKKKKVEDRSPERSEAIIVSSDDNLLKSQQEKEAAKESASEDIIESIDSIDSDEEAVTRTDAEEVIAEDTDAEEVAEEAEATAVESAAETDGKEAMLLAFEAWLDDSMADEEAREAAKAAMSDVHDSLMNGNYDDALFDVIAKGADYDRAVTEAEKTGEIRGRNTRIEELMTNEAVDDGVPHPGANGGGKPPKGYSIFDLARM